MPVIFDLLYREYCRARLAEMREQLLLRPAAGNDRPRATFAFDMAQRPAQIDIVRRAYFLWEQARQPHGEDERFYLEAERQLREELDASQSDDGDRSV